MFNAGDLVANKFQIDRVIGRGGMGFVVAATHIHLGQRVALKFLLPEMATDRAIVERFLREARASAQLRGEHVCRVSDVGMLDSGAPYFVMELLEGQDLASLLTERGPFAVPVLADYVVQACLGLAEAHAAQIVHRDLKPANLFLTVRPDGTPLIKIVDFGIAKASATADFNLTRTDAVMGSPGYMSPEQLRSTRTADARSDIWALGVILYELATGRQPFTAESITDLALRIAMDPTPQLRSTAPGFDRVVYLCLEKDPARRFQDVAQLAMALAPFGGPALRERAAGVGRVLAGTSAAAVSSPAVTVAAAPTTLGASAASMERVGRDRVRWAVIVGGIAVGTLAAIVFVKLRGDARPTPTAEPPNTTPAAEIHGGQTPEPGPAPDRMPNPTSGPAATVDTTGPHGVPPADAGAPADATIAAIAVDASVPRPDATRPPAFATGAAPAHGTTVPADAAVPQDAARRTDAAPPVDAAPRGGSAPVVRKVTKPRPAPSPDDDVESSRR